MANTWTWDFNGWRGPAQSATVMSSFTVEPVTIRGYNDKGQRVTLYGWGGTPSNDGGAGLMTGSTTGSLAVTHGTYVEIDVASIQSSFRSSGDFSIRLNQKSGTFYEVFGAATIGVCGGELLASGAASSQAINLGKVCSSGYRYLTVQPGISSAPELLLYNLSMVY